MTSLCPGNRYYGAILSGNKHAACCASAVRIIYYMYIITPGAVEWHCRARKIMIDLS